MQLLSCTAAVVCTVYPSEVKLVRDGLNCYSLSIRLVPSLLNLKNRRPAAVLLLVLPVIPCKVGHRSSTAITMMLTIDCFRHCPFRGTITVKERLECSPQSRPF